MYECILGESTHLFEQVAHNRTPPHEPAHLLPVSWIILVLAARASDWPPRLTTDRTVGSIFRIRINPAHSRGVSITTWLHQCVVLLIRLQVGALTQRNNVSQQKARWLDSWKCENCWSTAQPIAAARPLAANRSGVRPRQAPSQIPELYRHPCLSDARYVFIYIAGRGRCLYYYCTGNELEALTHLANLCLIHLETTVQRIALRTVECRSAV